mgnify:CR=1 FL=1
MSGYEEAPATALVATNCACCGRALVDALIDIPIVLPPLVVVRRLRSVSRSAWAEM